MTVTHNAAAGGKKESALVKFAVSGGVTLVYEVCLGHFLEFLKVAKQTQPGTYYQIASQIIGKKGIIGVLDGFIPFGAIQALAKGSVFGWGQVAALNSLQPLVQKDYMTHQTANIVAGGIGGGFQGFVLSPTLLLKTRVMTNPIFRENMTLAETSRRATMVGMEVIRKEGALALMKGSVVFSLKRVADWTTRYMFATWFENVLYKRGDPKRKLTTNEEMIASLLGGTTSALATLPADVMVAQIQQAKKAGQRVSVVQMFKEQLATGGIRGVTEFASRGFVARVAHVAFTTALMKTGASAVYRLIYGDKQ